MTISVTTRKAGPYAGNGATTIFAFAFKAFSTSDPIVTVLDQTNAETILVKDVHYSVALNVNQDTSPGGTITYPISGSPMESNHRLTITSGAAELQSTHLTIGGGFSPSVIETNLDYLTALVQQHAEKLSRVILTAVSDPTALTNLPVVASRQGKYLAFDVSGNPTVSSGTGNDSALRTDLANVASGPGNTLVAYKRTQAEVIAGVTIVNGYYPEGYVDRYGTNTTPGTTDMTSAIQAAVNAARATGGTGRIYFLANTYLMTSTIVLASNALQPVDIQGSHPMWYGTTIGTFITGNVAGPMFDMSGADISHFSTASEIANVQISNTSSNASASCVRCSYSGGFRLYKSWLRSNNYGIDSVAEGISVRLTESIIDSTTLAVANIHGMYRNLVVVGGRIYSAQYALDISGDDPLFLGTNFEFCQVIFRHQALSGANFIGCHIESTQCLLTNATTVPINQGGAWVDNGSAGIGITGVVKFIGGAIFFANANTNIVTIKSQASFNYVLEFDSVAFTATNPIVGGSFAPGSGVALSSGTRIIVRNTIGLNIQKPPVDASSGYLFENAGAQGFVDMAGLKIGGNELASTLRSNATYTPTWASTGTQPAIGNGTITGRFCQIGSLVFFWVNVSAGSTTTFGTGNYTFSLPVASLRDGGAGVAYGIKQGVGEYTGVCVIAGGVAVAETPGSVVSRWSGTVPFTMASTDNIQVCGCYMA